MLSPIHNTNALMRPWREGVLLLDAVSINYGPRELLGRFFLAAAGVARSIGVIIRVHSDLTSLSEINAEIPEARGHLHPPFDTNFSHLPSETAFWISAHIPGGRMIGCCAAKLLDVGEAGLTPEFESLRLFYADPEPYLANGTTCRAVGDARIAADAMTGRIAYSGAHWTHPDYRGRGVVYTMVRLTRALALTRWDTVYTAGITAKDLAAYKQLHPYGYRKSDGIIHFDGTYAGDFQLHLIWMAKDLLIEDLGNYIAQAAAKMVRVTDADETMVPALPLQGRRRRS